MALFEEIMKQFQLIDDTILSDSNHDNNTQLESLEFSKKLLDTKQWFARISWAHKKQFILCLLDDVKSIRTICLVLKSIWNCRPKDAVMSISGPKLWSRYDRVPMDHDRTALPPFSLKNVMKNDRTWFQSLKPDEQYLVLAELLSISGGPIMWEVLQHSRPIYENYLEQESLNLLECSLVNETPPEKKVIAPEPAKKDQAPRRKSSFTQVSDSKHIPLPGQSQKEFETNFTLWLSTIKSFKDSMKLEEWEYVYKDDTKKRIWKANRPKVEAVDTVDIIQMLPSTISKCILSYLPSTQLGECARVNKYWAYLVDEIRSELTTRQKIDAELEKLRENMLRHDSSLSLESKPELSTKGANKSKKSNNAKKSYTYPWKATNKKANKNKACTETVRNMADFNEQLERRGAAHQNIWRWCENISTIYKKFDEQKFIARLELYYKKYLGGSGKNACIYKIQNLNLQKID